MEAWEGRTPIRIGSPAAVVALLGPAFAEQPHEELRVLHLDADLRLLRVSPARSGSARAVAVPIRATIGEALALGSRLIVLAHNHPGGDPAPSRADRRATRRFAEIALALDIRVIDHLVLTTTTWSSFRAMRLL